MFGLIQRTYQGLVAWSKSINAFNWILNVSPTVDFPFEVLKLSVEVFDPGIDPIPEVVDPVVDGARLRLLAPIADWLANDDNPVDRESVDPGLMVIPFNELEDVDDLDNVLVP